MECEEAEEDTRPIAFRVEINEETRDHFIKYAKESGLVRINDFFCKFLSFWRTKSSRKMIISAHPKMKSMYQETQEI